MTSSSTPTSPSLPVAVDESATDTDNAALPSLIDISDTDRPIISAQTSTNPPRRSNRVKAQVSSPFSRKSSSSRCPTARRRIGPPMRPPSPVAMPAPSMPDIQPASSAPPAVFSPTVPQASVPPIPATNMSPSSAASDPLVPPASAPPPAPNAPHPLRNQLVDILHTLSDNQVLFFDYTLAHD